ncbi:MAG TPA: ABC transporter ATP-binding protein [Tissierellia bacterium]|nr:ABC transporter ATP-binding protein [Tissierellia bacterium]
MSPLTKRVLRDTVGLSKRYVLVSLIAGISSAIYPLISIYISRRIIDMLAQSMAYTELLRFILLGLGAVFIAQIISGLFNYVHQFEQAEFHQRLELARNKKSIDMAFGYAEDPATKDLRHKITIIGYGGTPSFEMIAYSIKDLVSYVVSVIGAAWLILPAFFYRTETVYDSPIFFVVFIGLLLLFAYLPHRYNQRQNDKMNQLFQEVHSANTTFNYLADMVFNPEAGKEIRLYRQQPKINRWFAANTDPNGSAVRWMRELTWSMGKLSLISFSTNQVVILFLYLLVGFKGIAGGLPLGHIVAATAALNVLISVLSELITHLSVMGSDSSGVQLHYDYMDLPNQTQVGSIPVEKRLDNDYQLSAKGISFSYPGTDRPVLKDISVDFSVGKSYAIVGENGSGKTTFIKLLTRLYDPDQGEVTLNDIAANKYDAHQYYSLFNVVFQDFDLFSFKLGETIATDQSYDQAKVLQALSEVGFRDRFDQLPKGLDTSLNKEFDSEGITLSGGEKQKLALARAIYNDGPIYVLDEPTAALDPISEFEIYQKFHQITRGKTSLIISHRLSSCRFSDEILVFDHGRIVQRGSHEELVAVAGKYAELWNAQAKHYQAEAIDLSRLGLTEATSA